MVWVEILLSVQSWGSEHIVWNWRHLLCSMGMTVLSSSGSYDNYLRWLRSVGSEDMMGSEGFGGTINRVHLMLVAVTSPVIWGHTLVVLTM